MSALFYASFNCSPSYKNVYTYELAELLQKQQL